MKKPVPENYEELLNMAKGKPSRSIFDAEITDEMRQEWAKKRRKKKIVDTIYGVILVVGTIIVLSLLTLDYLDCSSRGGAYIRSMFWYTCIEAR
jgi:hypothetical protein